MVFTLRCWAHSGSRSLLTYMNEHRPLRKRAQTWVPPLRMARHTARGRGFWLTGCPLSCVLGYFGLCVPIRRGQKWVKNNLFHKLPRTIWDADRCVFSPCTGLFGLFSSSVCPPCWAPQRAKKAFLQLCLGTKVAQNGPKKGQGVRRCPFFRLLQVQNPA